MEIEGPPIILLFVIVSFQSSAGGGCHWEGGQRHRALPTILTCHLPQLGLDALSVTCPVAVRFSVLYTSLSMVFTVKW